MIADVDKSFASNADDALLHVPGARSRTTTTTSAARRGRTSTLYRQTQFVVNLMNGTQFGGVVDPRMSRMLSPVAGRRVSRTRYRTVADSARLDRQPAAEQLLRLCREAPVRALPGRYIFDDKAKIPLMTYAQLQFIKAEAAFRMGDKATALDAYRNGISSHIDFVNARNTDDGQTPTQITAAEKAAFLAVPRDRPAAGWLTLTQIMSQKYIAQWGWGHNELWMDMRRYHYTDLDPASGEQVFPGFDAADDALCRQRRQARAAHPPEIQLRVRVEPVPGSTTIGGLATDYHTKPLWITLP